MRYVSSKPLTITRGEFNRLKAGDVVLWRDATFRIVHHGPADAEGRGRRLRTNYSVEFTKISNVGLMKGVTTYLFTDVCRVISLPPRGKYDRAAVCSAEVDRVRSLGHDPIELLRSEIAWHDYLNKCAGYVRWPRAYRYALATLRKLTRGNHGRPKDRIAKGRRRTPCT